MQQDKHNTLQNRSSHLQRSDVKSQDTLDLREFWNTLVRHKRMIMLVGGTTLLLTLAVTLASKNVYRATATLQIEREPTKAVEIDFLGAGDIRDTRDFYQTQFELIRSRALAAKVIEELKLKEKLSNVSLFGQFKQWLGLTDNTNEQMALETLLLEHLNLEPIKNSRLAAVSYDSSNPEQAAEIANAVVDIFQKMNMDRRITATNDVKNYLNISITEARVKLDESVQKLESYSREHGIIPVDGKGETIASLKLKKLTEELLLVQKQRSENESKYELLNDKTRKLADRFGVLEDNAAYLQTMRQNLDHLKALQDKNPSAAQRKLIRQKEGEIQVEVDNKLSSLRGELASIKRREAAIHESTARAKTEALQEQDKIIGHSTLQREVDTNQELYQGLLQRLKEISIAGGMTSNNISVIDRAQVPVNKFKPNLMTNLSFGALLGLLLGISGAFLREFMDDKVKSINELESTTQLSVLGIVPEILNSTPSQLAQLTIKEPKSSIAEAFRSLRTAMRFILRTENNAVIFVTSACAGEGKSTSATNLACAYANAGSRVLLIDADLRNPSLHKMLDINTPTGLADYLKGNASINTLVQSTEVSNLNLIPAGVLPEDPSELLSSPLMRELLSSARGEYDQIILDGPPILGLADALVLSSLADATLIAVRAESTRLGAVNNALKRLRQSHATISGILLNRVALHRGSSYGYGYDYSDYYYNTDKSKPHSAGKKAVVTTLRSLRLL
ncbi:MAG: polysaccharide biosynthesis tyrosine autokinase [Thiothrix sp.]|uniref:GumC family protein n=1 Tax=Thiothrix sp. TaxID=1032 RepID=UPI00261069B9|nr:polysaccharide biosynthesis tyrosine autokinase [Thiothrix sp.]MDD5392012.1 polysaccharide biosynthesis tyrosine autokinase [Thiothrix sp.]